MTPRRRRSVEQMLAQPEVPRRRGTRLVALEIIARDQLARCPACRALHRFRSDFFECPTTRGLWFRVEEMPDAARP